MSLDGFSMYPLVTELNKQLAGGRIDRISQPNKHTVLLAVRQPGQNFSLHISINPQNPVINLITRSVENPAEPPVFCMVLRKQIEGGRIAEIKQHVLDRIVLIDIDTLGAGGIILTKTLVIELMGKYSNMILLHETKIIDCLRKVGTTSSRVRLVLPGYEYALPPNQDKLNIMTDSIDTLIEDLKKYPELKLVKAIVQTAIGLGPVSAREFVFSAGFSANILVGELDETDFASLKASIMEILTLFRENKITPILFLDENNKIAASAGFPLHYLENVLPQTFTTMSELIDFSTKLTGNYTLPDKDRFQKLVHAELTKAANKATVLAKELIQAQNAEDYKIKGDILMTYQYQLSDHLGETVELPNIYEEEPEKHPLQISLDKRYSIIQNMQTYYHKYDKLKRAQNLLQIQIEQCQQDLKYLSSVESSLESSSTLIEIGEIKTELIASGYLHEHIKKKASEKPSQPFKFKAKDGTIILVGKNNYQNDKLTFKTAHRKDIWLHTKDFPGSHVLIRCENDTPAEDTLLLAANLAAYFSKANHSSKVPVDYTPCRYVKKPTGAKPGFVIFTNQKTLYVTPNEKELALLILQDLNKK